MLTAKAPALPRQGLPGWGPPVLGGLTFTAPAGLWPTSALWFSTAIGVTPWAG
ncbi:hypothetical protein FHR32_001735 [Streptosporangium album]|uniref:Uncharacterized protein n=1 Tax=Streptosporangium album TaxID=47479 RepID=A0A7W7RSK8_9ACTN|nr:DUF6529 family protein [Streptosporangium album]MBB4937430.1 hypothetical protein [Streptosporangium album]